MTTFYEYLQNPYILAVLIIWELTWKGIALWTSAKNNQKLWFTAILIVNSIGILPIIYLLINRKTQVK